MSLEGPYKRHSLTPAGKRSARFKEAQNKLTSMELEEQHKQNRTLSVKPVVHLTALELQKARTWFTEFLSDVYPDVDAEITYFTVGAKLPDMVLMKEYARYLVRSRVGQINDKLSVNTVQHYIGMIQAVIQRASGIPTMEMAPMRQELRYFVSNDLVQQEGLRTAMHHKRMAHSDDVTLILNELYKPTYLNSFLNMRTVLNLTLYMNLIVDLCGRGGEIARHPQRPAHMCLTWGDVQFYTFQSTEGEMAVRASVTVRWGKGHELVEWKHKIIPLAGLLPSSLAMQDTLRLLMTLALLDGVFSDGVRSWEDFSNLKQPADVAPTGRIIAMNPEMKGIPILRRLKNNKVTNDPVQTGDMQNEIRRLGIFCGFEHRFTAYCLRRGVAFMLATYTTPTNRRFLMGHTTDETFRAYQSPVSTVDFPAMFRGLEQRSVLPQIGISLNRSTAAPLRLSKQGEQRVMEGEEVKSTYKEKERIRNMIQTKHGSIAAGNRSADPLCDQYNELQQLYRAAINSASKKQFKKEYASHFEQLSAASSSTSVTFDERIGERAEEESNLFARLLSRADGVQDISTTEGDLHATGGESGILEEAFNLLEPSMSGDWRADESDSEEGDPIWTDDVQLPKAQIMDTEDANCFTEETAALHGHPEDVRGYRRSRAHTKIGASAYIDFVADINSRVTEADLCRCMMKWYSVCHGLDEFPPGEEPFPGSYNCRFCGIDLTDVHHSYEHTHACAKTDADARAKQLLESLAPLDQPCQYQVCGHKKTLGEFVLCGKTFSNVRDRGEHMRGHVRSMDKNGINGDKVATCFFGECAKNPEGGRLDRDGPDFHSDEERLAHVWEAHQVVTLKTTNVVYCEYCNEWLLEPHQWITHSSTHLQEAQAIVKEIGYCGVLAGRAVIPRICPFCFHDESLPDHQRLATYSREGHIVHVAAHVQDTEPRNCPCHPSMCTTADAMDDVQLKDHLEIVHRIKLAERAMSRKKRGRKALKDVTNKQQPPKKIVKTTGED